ncbi:MAG: DNA (cytosine-5-)-methyltransferase [Candidatus Lokiarchaeota archaeon]|nr:DNA (cytosine-5-)-methyltransferase [Candidatus Lokiarchaeota archaeon]
MSKKTGFLKTIDLFCGAGGFSKGFELAGFNILAGIDYNENLRKTYVNNHNNSEFIHHDILEGVLDEFNDNTIKMIIGSPPCQGFSDARGNRDTTSCFEELRNSLPIRYLDWVEAIHPEIALMENVSGMATMKIDSKLFLEEIKRVVEKLNYNIQIGLLDSSYYGVPQKRVRVFCVIYKDKYKNVLDLFPFPLPKYIPDDFEKRKPLKRKVDIWYFEETEKYFFPKESEIQPIRTMNDVLYDLPEVTNETGTVTYKVFEGLNKYQKYLRKNTSENVSLHYILKKPKEEELKILKNIPEGKIYRSSRFGDRYIGVWDLFKTELRPDERFILLFLSRFRTREEYKTKKGKYSEGYLLESLFSDFKTMLKMMEENEYLSKDELVEYKKYFIEENNKENTDPYTTLERLKGDGWLRAKETKNGRAYDINTKSGIRPLYLRLDRNSPSRTIMTTSFRVRELVHPTQDRPITFREGARIQSFPDDFEFFGTPKEIATMIGNAVPPLMAFKLGKYYRYILKNHGEGLIDDLFDKFLNNKNKLITEFI